MAKKETRPKRPAAPKKAAAPPRATAAVPRETVSPPAQAAPPDPAAAKSEAVKMAVARQLEADGRWHLAHELTKVMGTDYRYDEDSMRGFLHAVHRILAARQPPYTFQYDAAFVTTALGLDASALTAAVDENTTAD